MVWIAVFAAVLSAGTTNGYGADKTWRDNRGRLRVRPAPARAELNNPWPAQWEDQLASRADHALKYWSRKKLGFNTWGENEKAGYPQMMWAYLLGRTDRAVKAFEEDDTQRADHKHTAGVDFYWCFTLKGQMRKYFYFGEALSEAYRAKFRRGAKVWTGADPLRRPHPVYGKGGKGGVWGPDAKGSWIDVRKTDNLRAMADTSVYLMAEHTGNVETQRLYRQRIFAYVWMLYNTGMMEWDSENYHGHTLAPYHNLYDFARDPGVKKLAKAALDWLYAAGAVKYWRGGFGGPNNRDYGGGNVVFAGGAVQPLWLYFGDTVGENPGGHYDDVHHITSGYRPPAAVVELARKHFARPVEVLATKPYYSLWDGESRTRPQYWETTYFGKTYQLGSARSKEPMKPWTPCMFKMTAWNAKRGVDFVVVNTAKPGGHSVKNAGDQIAQYRNLLIWLRPATTGERTFTFQFPRAARHEVAGGVWFVRLDKTTLAIRPINLSKPADYALPKTLDKIDKRTRTPKPNPRYERYKDEAYFQATATGDSFAGFALEVGEAGSHGNYDAFKAAVTSKSTLDTDTLAGGAVTLTGAGGRTLKLTHNAANDLPRIERDGKPFDYEANLDVYRPVGPNGPIEQKRLSGTLTVRAGGKVFSCTLTRDGAVTWSNSTVP